VADPQTLSTEMVKAYFIKGAMIGFDPVWLSGTTREEAEAQFWQWFHQQNQKVVDAERAKIWAVLTEAFKKVTGNG